MTSDYSAAAIGDEHGDAWVRHLAVAWRAVADPGGAHRPPSRPDGSLSDDKWDHIAWWAPLLQLVTFGLGWPRPDLGLARWDASGRPTEDSRLALLDRWWGDALPEFVDWALTSRSVINLTHNVGLGTQTSTSTDPPAAFGIHSPDWHHWGSDHDPMHLGHHAMTPVMGDPTAQFVVGDRPTPTQPGRAVLMVDDYAGWYSALHQHGDTLPTVPGGRPWRIDVVCRPLGWLGTYRRSWVSGRWFAGQHRWHELGIP